MAGVHGLHHVESLSRPDFTHNDPVWTHSEGVDDQLPDRDRAVTVNVRRPGFEPRIVFLVKLQLRGIFDSYYRSSSELTLSNHAA